MSTSTSHAYGWLKQLPSSLLHFEELPAIGHSPPFPWQQFSEKLGDLFEQPLEIRPGELHNLPAEELLLNPQDSLFKRFVAIHPLEGHVCFIMPKSAIPHLISHLIKKEEGALNQFDEDFQQSFATFLAIEVLYTITHLDFDSGLSFRFLEEAELPKEAALCLDIDIVLPMQTLPGRLIISGELTHAWKERYHEQQFDLLLNSLIAKKVPVTVHLEGGRVDISQKELKKLKTGDFLVLDSCTLQPGDNKGRVMLMVNQRPFMRGKIKDGTLKLLDTPVLETGVEMAKKQEHEEEEIEPEEEFAYEDEIDLDESEVEDSEHAEEEEAPPPKPEAEANFVKISPGTLPMTIVIEAGRLQLPLQKLLELQPGSMLELDLTPQSGVDLVINGKKIGKGELLAIGETLGVRILEI